LVEKIESAAKADPEIREAVEALANDVDAAAKVNPELEKAIKELTEAVKAQHSSSQNPAKLAETIGIHNRLFRMVKFIRLLVKVASRFIKPLEYSRPNGNGQS
jgi:hypothetical protein